MHHAHRDNGSGWCPFDDIMLAVRHVRRATAGAVQKVLVVDLDAHQGNGVERDKLHFQDTDLFIVDAYNCRCFPSMWSLLARDLLCVLRSALVCVHHVHCTPAAGMCAYSSMLVCTSGGAACQCCSATTGHCFSAPRLTACGAVYEQAAARRASMQACDVTRHTQPCWVQEHGASAKAAE
jgi:hypothetical protein